VHANGCGDLGAFIVAHDITRYTKAKLFSAVGK
jgi:catalase